MPEQLSLFDATPDTQPSTPAFGFPELAALAAFKLGEWQTRFDRALTELRAA